MACESCKQAKAILIRPRNRMKVCKDCFFRHFEEEVHSTIICNKLFNKGDRVGIGISGGKDSTVLAYVLKMLNERHNYGLDLVLLCVDEGIAGYRDSSISTVYENQRGLNLDLKIMSFNENFGVTMDKVVEKIGKRGNCTYCGIFRRQSLEEAGRQMGVNSIATGHNADDIAETVILNLLRGDISRLRRCTMARTESHKLSDSKVLSVNRIKPFKHIYQKEIVLYAFHKKLKYFSTECTYSPGASRGDVRILIKELEKINPQIVLNIIKSGDDLYLPSKPTGVVVTCIRCGHPTSSKDSVCKGCMLLETML